MPSKSAGETTAAIASGNMDFAFGEVTSVQVVARGGKVRALATAADHVVGTMPDGTGSTATYTAP